MTRYNNFSHNKEFPLQFTSREDSSFFHKDRDSPTEILIIWTENLHVDREAKTKLKSFYVETILKATH